MCNVYRPLQLRGKKVEVKKKKDFAELLTLFQTKGESGNKTFFFLGLSNTFRIRIVYW